MRNRQVAAELLKMAKDLSAAVAPGMDRDLAAVIDHCQQVRRIMKKNPEDFPGALEVRISQLRKLSQELLLYTKGKK